MVSGVFTKLARAYAVFSSSHHFNSPSMVSLAFNTKHLRPKSSSFQHPTSPSPPPATRLSRAHALHSLWAAGRSRTSSSHRKNGPVRGCQCDPQTGGVREYGLNGLLDPKLYKVVDLHKKLVVIEGIRAEIVVIFKEQIGCLPRPTQARR